MSPTTSSDLHNILVYPGSPSSIFDHQMNSDPDMIAIDMQTDDKDPLKMMSLKQVPVLFTKTQRKSLETSAVLLYTMTIHYVLPSLCLLVCV